METWKVKQQAGNDWIPLNAFTEKRVIVPDPTSSHFEELDLLRESFRWNRIFFFSSNLIQHQAELDDLRVQI